MHGAMDRRNFLQVLGAATLGLGVTGCGKTGEDVGEGGPRRSAPVQTSGPQMVIASGADPASITRAAIDGLGGMGVFVRRGDRVLLKPNVGWDRVPQQAATTNPVVVSTLVTLCLDAGAAKVLVVDNSINDPRRCYVRSGIKEAVEKAGAEMPFMEDYKFKTVKVGGELIKQWPVYTDALEVDRIINVPIAKHHSLSRLTIGMKNFYGLMGGRRNQLHQDVHQSIAEMTAFFRPELTVVDAVRILIANGPTGGSLSDVKETNTVIASIDPVAADAQAATLFGIAGKDIPYLVRGEQMGLGSADPSTLRVKEVSV